jgi:hypothetical protein
MHGMDNSIMRSFGGSRLLGGTADAQHGNYQLPMNMNPAIPAPAGSPWQHNAATGLMAYVDDMYAGPQVYSYAGIEADLYMTDNRQMDYTDENLQCSNPYGLTYAIGALTPAAWGGLSDLAYAAAMHDHVAGTTGPLTAGNLQMRGLGHQAFAAPFLDAAGFECSAFRYDDYCGTPEEQYSRRFIMNHRPISRIFCPFRTDFGPYVPDGDEERIFDELSAMSAFYGFCPTLTKLYDEFPSYITAPEYPVLANIVAGYVRIVDALHAAAWEPITLAQTSHEDVWIERFGPGADAVYFTLLNNPHLTTLNEESFPSWPPGPEFQAHDRDISVDVESLFDLGITGNLVIREEVTGDCFYPGFSNGLSAFAAQGDWDGLTITRHDGASFLMPARALRAFAVSGSMEVDNDREAVTHPADDTPYFSTTGSGWQDWFDGSANEGDALFSASSLYGPTATFKWSVIEPGTRTVTVVWPDQGQKRAMARYQVLLNGVPYGQPVDLNQNTNTGMWQTVTTVTTTATWPACDTVELVVSHAVHGSLEPLAVDGARFE